MAEVALITGCATGIGRALAIRLSQVRDGQDRSAFKVYATDYRVECVQDLESLGIQVGQLDVTKVDSVRDCVAGILKKEGRIDLCVCNAGVAAAGFISEMDYDTVEKLFDVNVHGVFRTIQAVLPGMMDRQSGKIAFLGSVNAHYAAIFNGPYSGAKAAINTMAESLRMELAPFSINVTTVIPAWVKSDIINNANETFDRYERPESFFNKSVPYIRELRKNGIKQGCTTQEAARDIAAGLSKPTPPRFLYTGHTLFYSLLWGFVQQWFRPQWLADSLQKRLHLEECAQHAPTTWAGPYKKPATPPLQVDPAAQVSVKNCIY